MLPRYLGRVFEHSLHTTAGPEDVQSSDHDYAIR